MIQTHTTHVLVLLAAAVFGMPTHAGEVSLDQKMIWSHMVGWHSWNFANYSYSMFHDVPMAHPTGDPVEDYRTEIEAMLDAGIDGINFDVIGGNEFNTQLQYLLEAAKGTRLQVAHTICGTYEDDPTKQAKKLADVIERFRDYPNYALIDGRPIVFIFSVRKKPPAYWAVVRQSLLEKFNINIFLAGNPDSTWNRPVTAEGLSQYAGIFDIFYNYAEYGRGGNQPVYETFRVISETAPEATRSGAWASAIAPGYVGPWPVNGRNTYHIPFRGVDTFWESWQAAVAHDADWVHLADWNDLDETPLQPTMFQFHTYGEINRYWAHRWRGQEDFAQTPRVYFAYQREQLLGTLQRIEVVSLPMAGYERLTVKCELIDHQGEVVANLKAKTLAADKAVRDEWRIDTVRFAKTPSLQPRITIQWGDQTVERNLPLIRLRTGWIKNQVVIKVPAHEIAPGEALLSLNDDGNGILSASLEVDSPHPIRHATLWADDRPIGSLDTQADVPPTFGLIWHWHQDHHESIAIQNGSVVRAYQNGPHAARFASDAGHIEGYLNRYDYLAANVSGNPEDLALVIRIDDGAEQIIPLQKLLTEKEGTPLLNSDQQPVATLMLSDYDPVATLPRTLDLSKGRLYGRFPIAFPSPADLFYVRLETQDGRTFFSNAVTPYADPNKTVKATVLRTVTTLDSRWDLCWLGRPPQVEDQPMTVEAHPALVQMSYWDLGYPGTTKPDLYGDNPMYLGSAADYYKNAEHRTPTNITLPDGTAGLAFDGIDDVAELAIRQQPHGAFTLSMKVRFETVDKPQVVYGASSLANQPLLKLDAQGHLVAGRQAYTPGFDILARSQHPVPAGEWIRVRVTFDETTARLYLNDQLVGQTGGKVHRAYGEMRTYIGGIDQPFHGQIADVSLTATPFKWDDLQKNAR